MVAIMGNKVASNLTEGNVTKSLLKYMLPMVGSALVQAFFGMADIIMVGQFVGSGGMSGLNNSTQVIAMITNIAIGLTVGGNILISQYFGANRREDRREASGTLFTASMIAGFVSMALLLIFSHPLLQLLRAPSMEDAMTYLQVCAFGMPFIFGYNALSAIFRSIGNSRYPMIFILIASAVDMILNIVMIPVLHMGVLGAALSTVIGQAISFAVAFFFIMREREFFEFTKSFLKIRWDKLKQMLKLGIPTALQMSVAAFSWLFITYLLNDYGVVISSGNGISIKIKDISGLFLHAISNCTATMVAQNLGAKKFERAKKVLNSALLLAVILAVVNIILIEIFAYPLASIFTPEEAVRQAAVTNMRIEIFGQIFYALFLTYHGFAIGAGQTMFVLFSSFANCIVVRVVLAIILNNILGYMGIYLACMIAPFISVPIGYFYVKSNVWKRSIIEEKPEPQIET